MWGGVGQMWGGAGQTWRRCGSDVENICMETGALTSPVAACDVIYTSAVP